MSFITGNKVTSGRDKNSPGKRLINSSVSKRLQQMMIGEELCRPGPQSTFHCDADKAPQEIEAAALKVMTLNAAHGRHRALSQLFVSREKIQQNLRKISAVLRYEAPHIVALQEADAPSVWSGGFDHVALLREHAAFSSSVLGHHMETGLLHYGCAILGMARLFEHGSVKFEPSPPTTTKGFVSATYRWRVGEITTPVTVVSVHLDFSRRSIRERQIAALAKTFSGHDHPLIIMGDLNAHWGQRQSSVKHLCDGLKLQVYAPGHAGLGTFGGSGKLKSQRLDWVLISSHLKFESYRTLQHSLSDHKAVMASVTLR